MKSKIKDQKSKRSGFTLIELLVVISIIGILAALTLTGFSAARKNARDATRKSDLGQYRIALEAYSSSNGGLYPYNVCPASTTTTCKGNSVAASGIFKAAADSPLVDEYLPAHIKDPSSAGVYTYYYEQDTVSTGTSYKLFAEMETGGVWEVCSTGKAGKLKTLTTAAAVVALASSVCDTMVGE